MIYLSHVAHSYYVMPSLPSLSALFKKKKKSSTSVDHSCNFE